MDALEGFCRRELHFLRSDALRHGLDDKALRRALRSGTIVRVRHGAYTLADMWANAGAEERHLIRAAAVMRSARCAGVLSHTTAALVLGADVWDVRLDDVHVTRRDHKGGRREAGVVQHRGLLSPLEVAQEGRWTCTTATRTALDMTTITDVERALVVVCSLLHAKRTTMAELMEAAPAMVHVPGSLTTGLVLSLADARLESVGETRTWLAMWREGLPTPQPQYEIRDARDRLLAQLDFAWPEYGVWLEFDGKGKYLKPFREGETAADVVVREKKREDLVRRLTGWRCVRIVWADLAEPARLAASILQAFEDQRASRAGYR